VTFFKRKSISFNTTQIWETLTLILQTLRSFCCNSTKVRSGWVAIQSRICSRILGVNWLPDHSETGVYARSLPLPHTAESDVANADLKAIGQLSETDTALQENQHYLAPQIIRVGSRHQIFCRRV
jgi:hypothetical protein